MDRNRFANLIVGYCELCGIANPMEIVQGAPVETDGVLFSLVHSDPIDPSLLLIVGDAGDPPEKNDRTGCYAVLLQNFAFALHRGPVFSISPDSGQLLLTLAEEIAVLTPSLLAKRMEELAAHVRQWRESTIVAQPAEVSEPLPPQHTSHSISSTFRKLTHR